MFKHDFSYLYLKLEEIVLILKYQENRRKDHNFLKNLKKLFSYFVKNIQFVFKVQSAITTVHRTSLLINEIKKIYVY